MKPRQRKIDEIRRRRSGPENHLIDEYLAGRVGRREFLRRGSILGMSIPLVSFLAAACSGVTDRDDADTGVQENRPARRGGSFRLATPSPAGDPGPLTVIDTGGAHMLCTTGEYLCESLPTGEILPKLATSWEHNEDASIWTFSIQEGVIFHDDSPMTAEDVAATFNSQLGDEGSPTAMANLGAVLASGGAQASDPTTVVFELERSTGSFPALVSSASYTTIITPARIDLNDWVDQGMVATGPYVLDSYTPRVGAQFVRNDSYWDQENQPFLDTFSLRFYDDEAAMVVAFRGDEVDGIGTIGPPSAESLIGDERANIVALRSSEHRQLHVRNDHEPFTDKRVRQALALSLDREAIVNGLYPEGFSELGNDHPIAPVYPFMDESVPQRTQDLDQAKQLLLEAGVEPFNIELSTWNGLANDDYAQLVRTYAEQIGIRVDLNILDAAGYYGTDLWLTAEMGISEYTGRPVPNVFLSAPLQSDGVWNSSQFSNSTYDKLVDDFISAVDLNSQRRYAKEIQELLLDETPIIISFFVRRTDVVKPTVVGWQPTGTVTFDLSRVGYAE